MENSPNLHQIRAKLDRAQELLHTCVAQAGPPERDIEPFREVMTAFRRLLTPLTESQWTAQSEESLNHPLWLCGHLIWCIEQVGMDVGMPLSCSELWQELFGLRSLPQSNRRAHPSPSEMIAALNQAEEHFLAVLQAAWQREGQLPQQHMTSTDWRLSEMTGVAAGLVWQLAASYVATGVSIAPVRQSLETHFTLSYFIREGGLDLSAPMSLTRADEEDSSQVTWSWILERATIRRTIIAAFQDVALGDGVGLLEGQGLDDYADAATMKRYVATDERLDWGKIPVSQLRNCSSSLSFFDAKGMAFHLPAYLLADLDGFSVGEPIIRLIGAGDQFALIGPEQRRAVRAFLMHVQRSPDQRFAREEITDALSGYWADA